MKKLTLLLLFVSNFIFSQTLVKTYYDPYAKTKLKEVYQVKPNTPTINGYYKLYDEYGNLLEHRNYTNNKLNGKSTTYVGANEASVTYGGVQSLGKISDIANYKNGQLNGERLRYNFSENGKRYLEFRQTYKNDILVSNIFYFPNGQKKKILKIGKSFEYYENGNKFAEYTLNENEQIDGEYLGWSKSGYLEVKGFLVNDEKDGAWIEYNEDGTIKSKELYELGKRMQTPEEQEIAHQKEIAKAKKEEEKRKLLEEKRLAEQKETERIKRIEEERLALTKKVNEQSKEFELQIKNIEKLYVVEDKAGSMLFDETVYKTKKKHLYNAYVIATNYVKAELRKTDDLQQKVDLLTLGIELSEKISELRNTKNRDLEKKLKRIDQPLEIIETLGVKK
ncbi:toxin-antitoxin system YwqK family antitoxin [Allomuricauda sp. F6463D]|uniref:toxin-antitoxin system YwqK family antitoxin n=1 Tax=Allomuricauda sp. F6463D TaxID=2926409 RepID=UPI001FF4529D|nr:hypothetical protein [Muricauda sp. F6463D]MCK0162107.1 hypothetical protein [Muricauda sp. F6463D]